MIAIAILGSLAAVLLAPFCAGQVMGLKSSLGKGAMVGLITLGLMQIIGMVAQKLGPMGGVLGVMGTLAAWYQVVKVVHGTDTPGTIVFMFWHLFFQLLFLSLLALFLSAEVFWVFGF